MKTHETLSSQAQIVLDVIEREEVAQALRQDKVQNLNYLKEHFGVCIGPSPRTICSNPLTRLLFFLANARTNIRFIQVRSVPIHDWQLQWNSRLPLSLPCPLHGPRPEPLCTLGQTRVRYPPR